MPNTLFTLSVNMYHENSAYGYIHLVFAGSIVAENVLHIPFAIV